MLTHHFSQARQPERVVLLGASGFISKGMSAAMTAAGIACRPIPSTEVDLTENGAGDQLAELLQPEDVVIMPSALTPDKGRDTATLMKNLRMSEQVSTALARKPPQHVIYISSDAVYDWRSPLIDEESSCEPIDLYAVMHIARERILGAVCQSFRIPYTVVRPCAVYGYGDTHNSYGPNRFIRTALQDRRIRLFGAGEETRDHIYIADLVELLKRCVLHRSTGLLNAATGRAISFRALAEMVANAAGPGVEIETQPRSGPVTHRHFNITQIIRSFPGFQTTSLETGIREMLSRSIGAH